MGAVRDGHGDGAELRLGEAAVALYDDLRLSPLLSRLLQESSRLLDAHAGSISIVDAAAARYAKAAEHGAACQLGQSFPLDEGITGRVAERRGPVVLPRYADVPGAHLPASHPAARGAVAAVPIWWLGEVLGVNVVFAGCDRAFSTREVDQLEVLSQVGAAGIVAAAAADPGLPHLTGERPGDAVRRPAPLVVTEVGAVAHRDGATAAAARELVACVERVAAGRRPDARLRVVLLHRPDRLRVLLHDEGGARTAGTELPTGLRSDWSAVVTAHGGTLQVERVPGWGTLLLADLPRRADAAAPAPLSPREQQVLALLATGLTDLQVAQELFLARKTVEKHVSAVLRKTGTSSRTAAVVQALGRGWLPAPGQPSSAP